MNDEATKTETSEEETQQTHITLLGYFAKPTYAKKVAFHTAYNLDHAPRSARVYRIHIPIPSDALEETETVQGDVEVERVTKIAGRCGED